MFVGRPRRFPRLCSGEFFFFYVLEESLSVSSRRSPMCLQQQLPLFLDLLSVSLVCATLVL